MRYLFNVILFQYFLFAIFRALYMSLFKRVKKINVGEGIKYFGKIYLRVFETLESLSKTQKYPQPHRNPFLGSPFPTGLKYDLE
jgi:hypothetical protein